MTNSTCRSCGANRQPDATYCWQCYTPFPGAMAAARVATLAPAPAGLRQPGGGSTFPAFPSRGGSPSWGPPPRPPATTRGRVPSGVKIAVTIVVLAAAAFGGKTVWDRMSWNRLELPARVEAQSRMTSPQATMVEDMMVAGAKREGITAKVGIYGTGTQPRFVLLLARFDLTDAARAMVKSGVATGGETKADAAVGQPQVYTHGGEKFQCFQVQAGAPASMCGWQQGSGVGFGITFDKRVKEALRLTAAARAEVHG